MVKNALNERQRQFCREYVIDYNATQAALRAGYSKKTSYAQGHALLKLPEIQKVIDSLKLKHAENTGVTAERVLKELERLAFADRTVVALYNIKDPAALAFLPEDVRKTIHGWRWDKQGNLIIQFISKESSLELLGKHLKLFTEKYELTGKDGNPVVNVFANLSENQTAKIIAKLDDDF